jgi:hypothetical protein
MSRALEATKGDKLPHAKNANNDTRNAKKPKELCFDYLARHTIVPLEPNNTQLQFSRFSRTFAFFA